MSERKEKKHKKKKHKKDKKPRLHERVGYTDDDNPFGDRDLGATFVWKKKEDQSRKKKRPPPSRDEEDRIEEIEKVRRRRDAREAELAEMERLRDEEEDCATRSSSRTGRPRRRTFIATRRGFGVC